MKKKPAPKPEPRPKAILYAHVDAFIPMSEAGEFFEFAAARGWETHTDMPLVNEGGIFKRAYVGPEQVE